MKVFSEALVEEARVASRVADLSQATIGEILLVAQYLEKKTGIPFIRMDQGSPGLPPNKYGVQAEKEALDRGVGSQYPPADGVPVLSVYRFTCLTYHLSALTVAEPTVRYPSEEAVVFWSPHPSAFVKLFANGINSVPASNPGDVANSTS